jgi:hypothetical protein
MTEKEFQRIRKEIADHKRRTSFPAAENPRELYEAHGGHIVREASRH